MMALPKKRSLPYSYVNLHQETGGLVERDRGFVFGLAETEIRDVDFGARAGRVGRGQGGFTGAQRPRPDRLDDFELDHLRAGEGEPPGEGNREVDARRVRVEGNPILFFIFKGKGLVVYFGFPDRVFIRILFGQAVIGILSPDFDFPGSLVIEGDGPFRELGLDLDDGGVDRRDICPGRGRHGGDESGCTKAQPERMEMDFHDCLLDDGWVAGHPSVPPSPWTLREPGWVRRCGKERSAW